MTEEKSPGVGVEYITERKLPVIYKKILDKKIYLSSRYRPDMEAERLISGHEMEYNGIIFLIGGGNLCLLESICKVLRFEILVVIEPEDVVVSIIKEVCALRIDSEQREKIRFFDKEEWEMQAVQLFSEHPYHRARIFVNRAQAQLEAEKFNMVREKVAQAYNRKMINANTLAKFEKVWLRNLTKNTKFIGISPGIEALFGAMEKCAAVIIGAGPSLTKQLERLRKYQDQMCLIAVDTVTKTLHKNGIYPHIVVVIDPQKINAKYVENLHAEAIEKTIFICEPAVCGSALREKSDRIVLFDTLFPYYKFLMKFFEGKGDLDLGGSVANAAYDVAIKLGFGEVSLVGLDMCYAEDSYHVHGSMYEECWYSNATRLRPYESLRQTIMDLGDMKKSVGLRGDVVYLDSKFMMFSNWFTERQKKKVCLTKFYNCTEGGYPIEGIDNMSFEEFVCLNLGRHEGQFCSSWEKILEKLKGETRVRKEKFVSAWVGLKESLKKICGGIKKYKEVACKGEVVVERMLCMMHQEKGVEFQKQLEKLNCVDMELLKNFEGKEFINMALQKVIHQVMKETGEDVSLRETLENSRLMYRDIASTCDIAMRYLDVVVV